MTIKEKAEEYAISVSPYSQENGATWDKATEKAYIKGAKEQRKIDIEKACQWLKGQWTPTPNGNIRTFSKHDIEVFEKMMKEEE